MTLSEVIAKALATSQCATTTAAGLPSHIAAAVAAHLTSEAVENEVARMFVRQRGGFAIANDENWPIECREYRAKCAKWPGYASAHSLITSAFTDARAAIRAALGGDNA
jgi:hypothetical protein